MITCVILNYNDAQTTIKLVNNIKELDVIDAIVVVDGASTDDSYNQLIQLTNKKIHVIKTDKNGGYGYGNNAGIRYSKGLGADYVAVANPDVTFDAENIRQCLSFMKKHTECVAVSPKIIETHNNAQLAFRIASPLKDVAAASIILNKLIRPRYYPTDYFKTGTWKYVDVIPGSFVFFDINKLCECGLYDERNFLYSEEFIIGKKFKEKNYCSAIILTSSYRHEHSVSMRKTFRSPIATKRIGINSQIYYLKNYCHASKGCLLLLESIRPFVYIEAYIWELVKSFRAKTLGSIDRIKSPKKK